MTGLCRKEYLELIPPTEDDSRSAQVRIFDALAKLKEPIQFSVKSLRQLLQSAKRPTGKSPSL